MTETDRGLGATESNRCAVCGWPLADSSDKGCLRGNCSQRPLPRIFFDLMRARREYGRYFEGIADSATEIGLGADSPATIFDVRRPAVPPLNPKSSWCDEDIPLDVRNELMRLVPAIDYYYLCAIWRHGAASRASRGLSAEEPGLTFQELIDANCSRVNRWHPAGLGEWSALEWAGAMAGEAGEACNAAKKLKRIDSKLANINTEPGRSLTERNVATKQIAKEVADTIIYGALLAKAVGEDLAATIVEVFNAKSEEYGFPERLGASRAASDPAPPPAEPEGR